MADPFATVSDLESRWRPLSAAEAQRATVLLGDASAVIRAECPDAVTDPDETMIEKVIMVCCAMARRALQASLADLGEGVASVQLTAGPFATAVSYANPSGDVYLTKRERRVLGCSAQRAYVIDTLPVRAAVVDHKPFNVA
jgi:hypothetical protein